MKCSVIKVNSIFFCSFPQVETLGPKTGHDDYKIFLGKYFSLIGTGSIMNMVERRHVYACITT